MYAAAEPGGLTSRRAETPPNAASGRRFAFLGSIPRSNQFARELQDAAVFGDAGQEPLAACRARAEIEALLERHKGSIAEVARELDSQWAVVWRWVVQSGLNVEKYRA